VVAIFALRILTGQACTINGTGRDTRDYVHVADVARANVVALEKDATGIFNIGTGRPTSTNTIFSLLSENLDPAARAEHGPPRAGDLPASALDYAHARQALGWEPNVEIEDGIAETAEWFRQDRYK
jgi:UDP-glucose 4-epimerase